jgi:predicted Zn-dependent protease
VTVTSRIDDLRRRVDRDPASIAFAQLAEEYRRNGDHEEAVRVARAGLVHLPGYLSARVTLGRALLQLGQVEAARLELESVLMVAPDNLAALRTMAEIHDRRRASGALTASAAATDTLPDDPVAGLAASFAESPVDAAAQPDPKVDEVAAFLDSLGQFALDDTRTAVAMVSADTPAPAAERLPRDAATEALERWLAAIVADRAARG